MEDAERKWHQETQLRQNHWDSVTVIPEVSQKHAQDKDSSASTSFGNGQHSVGGER